MSGLERARALAVEANESYASIKREVESRVVRWEWATFTRQAHEPFWFEARKMPRGRLLASPEGKKERDHHGYDAQGRLVVERRFYGETLTNETLYRFVDGGIERYHYGGPKRFINVAWYSVDERGVHALDTVFKGKGHRSRTYAFDANGRVLGYEERGEVDGEPVLDARDFEYDDAGELTRVYWRYPDGRRTVYYERPTKGDSLKERAEILRARLVDAAAREIARLAITEPVFAIAVHWTDADRKERLPPEVAVGLERTDRARMQGDPYDPTEWEHFSLKLPLDDAFRALCKRVNADISVGDRQRAADKLFEEVARALGERPLPIEKTADFVAYAMNHDKGPAKKQAAKFRPTADARKRAQPTKKRARS